jgi:enterochelin esterase-like enzyme
MIWVPALVFLLAVSSPSAPAGPAATHGTLLHKTVHGPSLERNRMGESADRDVIVYLPPSYASSPQRRYPVIYVLCGIGDANTVWTRPWNDRHPGFATLPELMDAGVRARRLDEAILVIPDVRTTLPGSFYANSPVLGRWEDFITQDLVATTDRTYRTIAKPEARGLLGHSMGGHGAIKMGMKHPDVFSVVYAMNPAVLGWGEDVSLANPAFAKVLKVRTPQDVPGDDLYVAAIIAMSQAFSPDTTAPPLYISAPFREEQGRLVHAEPAYQQWTDQMPVFLVSRYESNLRRLRGLRFDSAFVDEFPHIPPTSRQLSDSLTAHRIPHTFEMYNGDHRNRVWGREGRLYTEVLPYFSARLTPPAAAGSK